MAYVTKPALLPADFGFTAESENKPKKLVKSKKASKSKAKSKGKKQSAKKPTKKPKVQTKRKLPWKT